MCSGRRTTGKRRNDLLADEAHKNDEEWKSGLPASPVMSSLVCIIYSVLILSTLKRRHFSPVLCRCLFGWPGQFV